MNVMVYNNRAHRASCKRVADKGELTPLETVVEDGLPSATCCHPDRLPSWGIAVDVHANSGQPVEDEAVEGPEEPVEDEATPAPEPEPVADEEPSEDPSAANEEPEGGAQIVAAGPGSTRLPGIYWRPILRDGTKRLAAVAGLEAVVDNLHRRVTLKGGYAEQFAANLWYIYNDAFAELKAWRSEDESYKEVSSDQTWAGRKAAYVLSIDWLNEYLAGVEAALHGKKSAGKGASKASKLGHKYAAQIWA